MNMKNLAIPLREKKTGWVALNKKNEIVASAVSFVKICKKVQQIKEELTLIPAAEDYSGYIS